MDNGELLLLKQMLISLSVLLLVACVGYMGWYFGHLEGFAKTKAQYSSQFNSQLKSDYSTNTSKSKAIISKTPAKTQYNSAAQAASC